MIKVSSDADKVLVAKVREAGQGQVFAHWDQLRSEEQASYLEQLRNMDLPLVRKLISQYLQGPREVLESRVLTAAPILRLSQSEEDPGGQEEVRAVGEDALRKGKVGIFTAAGETDSGLQFDLPRGLYPIGPVSGKTLFGLHADKIRALSRKYRAVFPWIIVVSQNDQEATLAHFKENDFFGLNRSDVSFMVQDQLPVVNRRGKILLSESGKIAMSPNGHGGVLMRLLADEPFASLEARGLEHLFYFQVDNPLVRMADPIFIGRHILNGSDVTSKAVCKVDPEEKVGIFCRFNGSLGVVEYHELSEGDKLRREPEGQLEFCAANVGIHIFSMEFLQYLREKKVELIYHFSERLTPYMDRKGNRVVPTRPNSIQFGCFIFDVLPFARSSLIVEVRREDEFSPVKNLSGNDSIDSAKRDLSRMFARWLRNAGAELDPSSGDDPDPIEISPLYSLDAEELKSKLVTPVAVKSGFYLE